MTGKHPLDTDTDAASLQFDALRRLTIAERAEVFAGLCADVDELARVGIRRDHPDLDEEGIRHELARRRFGSALADAAYPGAAALR